MAAQQLEKARKADFSPSAVSRAVFTDTLQKPYVLYPATIGILGLMASLLIGPASMFVIPAIVGGVTGAGAWLIDSTIRREHHARRYLQNMHELLAGQLDQTIENLKGEFNNLGSEQGANQLEQFSRKFHAFRELLVRKLSSEELTHARYLGMTEQVFLAGLDNLLSASSMLKGISAIDEKRLRERLNDLQSKERDLGDTEQRELQALQTRMDLFNKQNEKVAQMLAQNEEAMTQIDVVMAAISNMNTELDHASVDMETAMQELKRLAAMTNKYDK